ncbi:MAG: glycosyltransferase [Candidatus Nomurabacteria bacterium]|nr:glycosyltransferase [Candidatus Nomurabacteria bacterium]
MAKKILLINTTFTNGGASGVARSLFFDLKDQNISMYFAYGRGEKSLEKNTFKFGNSFETILHILFVRFLGLEGYGSYFSTRKLINYIKKEKFDAVNLHNLHGYYLNYFYFFKFLNKSGIPIIWTLHDEWPLTWLPAHSMGCNHCKTGVGNCTNSYSYPKTYNKLFLKFFLRRKQNLLSSINNIIFTPTPKWLKDEISKSYLKDKETRVIYYGVNPDLFSPSNRKIEIRKKYNIPNNKKVILFSAANLNDENKGVGDVLKVADILVSREYFFIGIGKGVLPKKENVITVGYIDNNKSLSELFAIADLFCITSRAETQPLVVLEAFSSGVPVVGFDIVALRELVNNNVGDLASFSDIQKLSDIIVSNLVESVHKEKSQNARNLSTTTFSKDIFLKNYLEIYNEILR